jgi:hypothetical protein
MAIDKRTRTRIALRKKKEADENVNLVAKKRKVEDDLRPNKKFAESSFLEKRAVAAVYYDMLTRKPMILITNKEQILAKNAMRYFSIFYILIWD